MPAKISPPLAGKASDRGPSKQRVSGPPSTESVAASNRPVLLAAIGCALFGFCHILNVHPVGDGIWYWYATALRHGQKLYSDLHLPMQPLFVFATEWNQRLLGTSWLASKALAAVQDIAFCCALSLVALGAPLRPRERALLVVAAFGTTITASYYRFDDYHVTGHCLVLLSIFLCLKLQREQDGTRILRYALLLGVLAGVSTANRLNDGALLGLTTGVALVVLAQRRRMAALGLFALTAAVSLLSLVLATGDSPRAWLNESILRAAAIKGGTGHVLYAPFQFPLTVVHNLRADHVYVHALLLAVLAMVLIPAAKYLRKNVAAARTPAAVLMVLGTCAALLVIRQANAGISLLAIADALVLLCYALLLYLLLHLIWLVLRGRTNEWHRSEVLFLFPFGQMFAGAMTSGQSLLEAYPPAAIMLLTIPLVFPAIRNSRVLRHSFLTLLLLLAGGTALSKWSYPYAWHHFNNAPMFTQRVWYTHPEFGPMYVERNHLALMQDMCGLLQKSDHAHPDLLAMPWPYPNYFCGVPPWHGFVQTWYDTTSAATVAQLVRDLQTAPPEWIAYQRATDSIAMHEIVFLKGARLPHRALDALIVDRLRSGAWTLSFQRCFSGADWLMIHTRAAKPGEPNDTLLPSTDLMTLCARTDHGYLR